MNNNFFNPTLQAAGSRIAAAKSDMRLRLDKNELSDDVDFNFKKKVLDHLMDADWNRYPGADLSDIEAKVADYCGLAAGNIVLSPGSAALITTLLNYFALNNKRIVIPQPTYSLFDYHCKTYNIPYESWYLSNELEYDYAQMPALDANTVLVITSPNNPVGNTFDPVRLENLLRQYPDTLILLDAVYTEFSETDMTPLVNTYENLLVLRSFSKAFPIAGLRLGYLCAQPQVAAAVRKLVLQFSINPLTLECARELLFNPGFQYQSRLRVEQIIEERERMRTRIGLQFDGEDVRVYGSEGNFLLLRLFNDAVFSAVLLRLEHAGIKVLNTSPFPMLRNTFRVSVGNPEENEAFLSCLFDALYDALASTASMHAVA